MGPPRACVPLVLRPLSSFLVVGHSQRKGHSCPLKQGLWEGASLPECKPFSHSSPLNQENRAGQEAAEYSEASNITQFQSANSLYSLKKSNSPCSVEGTSLDIKDRKTDSGAITKKCSTLTIKRNDWINNQIRPVQDTNGEFYMENTVSTFHFLGAS